MSPTINLGVDFADVKDADIFEPVPNGTYDFVVGQITETTSKSSGRPMLKWVLNIQHEGTERKLFYNTVLPFVDPSTGALDVSGVGLLVAICKATGEPWDGQDLNTEDYVGRGGQVIVGQKPKQVKDATGNWVDDPNAEPVNEVSKLVY